MAVIRTHKLRIRFSMNINSFKKSIELKLTVTNSGMLSSSSDVVDLVNRWLSTTRYTYETDQFNLIQLKSRIILKLLWQRRAQLRKRISF